MTGHSDFSLTFWGVRGSLACPGPDTIRYGGNTSCIEVRCGDYRMVFDGGTGLFQLGRQIAQSGNHIDLDLFFTHTHFDHITGIPFFAPIYNPNNKVRMWAGHTLRNKLTIRKVICDLMLAPMFPVPIQVIERACDFNDYDCGSVLEPAPGIRLITGPLNHPNDATGYRIEYQGKAACIITDTEHYPDRLDPNILKLIDNADLMVYDATYTDEEYPNYIGWGHSTWQEAIKLAEAANVDRTFLFHHDPMHDDLIMDRIARQAHNRRPGTMAAVEGTTVHI